MAKKKKSSKGMLEVGPSQRVVRLFLIEVTSDQKMGNWYCFIKTIHCIEILLAVFVVIKYGILCILSVLLEHKAANLTAIYEPSV
jgi:hypothetical protein